MNSSQSKNKINKNLSSHDADIPEESEKFTCSECSFNENCSVPVGKECNVFENDKYEILREVV